MKIYNYDKDTKIYTNSKDAKTNPLEPGEFLIPANAVVVVPPSVQPDEEVYYDAWWKTRKIRTEQPSRLHTWTDANGWEITAENLIIINAEIAAEEIKKQTYIKKQDAKKEAIASHPIADMTPIESMNWVENNVVADATVKEALKQLFKLTQARS